MRRLALWVIAILAFLTVALAPSAAAAEETPAPPVVITVLPEAPVFIDECGYENDGYILPDDTDQYYYHVTVVDTTDSPIEDATIYVVPREGFVFPPESEIGWYNVVIWDHSYDNFDNPCPAPATVQPTVNAAAPPPVDTITPPPVVAEPTATLAETNFDPGPTILVVVVLIVVGSIALLSHYRRRTNE